MGPNICQHIVNLLFGTRISPCSTSRDRLSASDMIQVRKVIEHVYEKVLRQGVENGHQSGESGDHEKEAQDISKLAAEKVELLCNDQVQIRNRSVLFMYS